ncbi:MAG: sensor histidine kinase, partial [Boseongicola sp.]|nr:sensor histidine kinase [Boseongicola sp.]
VAVAENLSALTAERQEMRRSVTFAFGIVGAFGIFAAAFLTTSLLAPLRKLSDDVKRRWESGVDLKSDNYPKEVAPLVNDINGLLVRNRDIIERGRRQAADLAHALKTPAAALRNEIESLDANGTDTALLSGALDRIDAQIQRSLSRMRATTAANGVNLSTDVSNSVERLHRLFSKLPDSSDKSFHLENAQVSVAMDQQDLEELIGNLLENAFKWCASAVSICVQKADGQAKVLVEDDGPGIAPKDRSFALADGARLDTSVPGTGLGLSIANDLAKAYGGSLQLETSEKLGGLKVEVTLPSIGSATAST